MSIERATDAKNALKARLGKRDWLCGIGVSQNEGVYFIQVNVTSLTPEVLRTVLTHVWGITVGIDKVGDIVALRPLI